MMQYLDENGKPLQKACCSKCKSCNDPNVQYCCMDAECDCHKKPKTCEASNTILMSNPLQYKCKNCGQTWFIKEETPFCHQPKETPFEKKMAYGNIFDACGVERPTPECNENCVIKDGVCVKEGETKTLESKEFRVKMIELYDKMTYPEEPEIDSQEFTRIISNLLKSEREKVIAELEKMKNDDTRFCNCGNGRCGYVQAIDDILKKLKS